MNSSSMKSLFVLLVVAHQVTARLPFGVPTRSFAPLTKRFYKKRLSSSASPMTLSSSSVVALPRCGAAEPNSVKGKEGKNNNIVGDHSARFAILLVGWSLGYLFFFPNGMMGDAGTPKAYLAANVGMVACLLLALGGCVGYASKTIGWKALIPGMVCQALMFFIIRDGTAV